MKFKNYSKNDWVKHWHNYQPESYTQALETAGELWVTFYARYRIDPLIKETKYKPMGGQKVAVIEQLATLLNGEGNLLIGQVGSGKTIVYGFLLYILKHSRYFDYLKLLHKDETNSPRVPFMIVTKTGVVTQTKRELKRHYNLTCLVLGYPALRSKVGTELFLNFKTIVRHGESIIVPVWQKQFAPSLILWDECQSLKNSSSQQTEIMRAYSLLGSPKAFRSIFVSATPWERSGESVSVIVGMRIKLRVDPISNTRDQLFINPFRDIPTVTPNDVKQTESLVQSIIGPQLIMDKVSPTANKRLQGVLDYNIVRIKNMHYKYKGKIQPRLIDPTPNQLAAYKTAFDEYQQARMQKGKDYLEGYAALMVAQQKFRQRAELLKAKNLSAMILEALDKGLTPGCACAFLDTLRVIHVHLTRAGIPKNQIGTIVGGQSMDIRQDMIDGYQDGSKKIMLFSIGAGGAGLSLHHDTDKTKPRYGVIPVTWSGIDIIQCLGRLHRLTSISPTLQDVCLLRGTIEETLVYPLLMRKKDSIGELIKSENEFTKQWAVSDQALGSDIKDHYQTPAEDVPVDGEDPLEDIEIEGLL